MPGEPDPIVAAIQRALATGPALITAPPADGESDTEATEQWIPNPRGHVLGWLAASVIVGERYRDSAIDAIPVAHPEHGWDRILLTRRVSCMLLAEEASNAFGIIELAPHDAPRLTDPDGNLLLALGDLLHSDIPGALDQLRARFPHIGLVAGDHSACPHTQAERYPWLYGVVARLLADYPDLIVARELLVDDQLIENAYHPLLVHTAGTGPALRYDWFALQSPVTGYAAFVRITGRQSVYRTDRMTWATPHEQLANLPEAEVRERLLAWLRLEPGPADQRAG